MKTKNPFIANKNGYRQITFNISSSKIENFSNWWSENGALAISFEEGEFDKTPVFAEPNNHGRFAEIKYWRKTIAKVLFDIKEDETKLMLKFLANNSFSKVKIISCENIPAKDWILENQKQFQPIILDKIAIIANWHKKIPKKINIQVDPGQAFGSGSHPTTKMILCWLENNKLENLSVLDYGCGSGILAIAAGKLGEKQNINVYATDIDKIAVQVTQENAKINQVNVKTVMPNKINDKFEIVLANILLKPIISLQTEFIKLIKPKGQILITGILENQYTTVKKEYLQNFSNIKIINKVDGWVLISAIKKA